MTNKSSEIDWSEFPCPLPTNIFEKYTQQAIASPLESLGINEHLWMQCRSFALKLVDQGFIDPISILFTSFKRYYPSSITLNGFTRWLLFTELNKTAFPINSLSYPSFQKANELIKSSEQTQSSNLPQAFDQFEQIWFLFSISILLTSNNYSIIPEVVTLDNTTRRSSLNHKRSNNSRLHCLFAVTPSGQYSNQLLVCKSGRYFKVNCASTTSTRIVDTTSGHISFEHIQQWLDDFLATPYLRKNSALLIDPRTTLLTPDFERSCETSNLQIITTDLNCYLKHVLSPFLSLLDKQWAEANRLDKMHMKSIGQIQRLIHTIWFSLRTLKQNDQIFKLYNQTSLWKSHDQEYVQSLQPPPPNSLPKKKKKKLLIKTETGTKPKLPSSSTMMTDPPVDSSPEQILLYILNRQISISRASKSLGGMKLDYLKYCLSYKMDSSCMTGSCLIQLNTFMQSRATIDWLRRLRALYFWPCAKQIFLREIYQFTGTITRKRSMNICGNNNMGSIRSCDQQSPGIFWRAFENIHQIQLDNESNIDDKQWNEDFEQYLAENDLNQDKAQLWTIDTFEFPLTKKSTILQLPEWNELRPMNLTPKVTVIYAFSSDGQSTEPYFVFPNSLRDEASNDEQESYNDLGHLTSQVFLSWIEKCFTQKNNCPIVLIFCARLPILSSIVLSTLKQHQIYPFGYPCTRTLPFRYLFERRVRNNRSTNLMSELWKKKLLDAQRTHVLKGVNCSVKNIKYYLQQIWPLLINEKRDDDDDKKTFEEKCQQAFQQANIQLIGKSKSKSTVKKTSKKTLPPSTARVEELVEQLNELLTAVGKVREQVNSTQILKIQNIDPSVSLDSNETIENVETSHASVISSDQIPMTNAIETISISSANDKRPSDENDEPRSSKRLRSSHSQSTNLSATAAAAASISQWIPPSKQLVTHLQSQSTSLFQFILSLVITILTSSENALTDEHCQWLHRTIDLQDSNYNIDKLNLLIETACIVAKNDLVR